LMFSYVDILSTVKNKYNYIFAKVKGVKGYSPV